MKKLIKAIAAIALFGLVASSVPAAAGIIVTVGKLPSMSSGDGTKTGDGARRPANCDGSTAAAPGVENTAMPKSGAKTSKTSSGSPSDCGCAPPSPADGPTGYDPSKCVPLGGGLIYCDDPAMGSGPGAGEGGGFDDADETPDGSDEIAALGCTGGGDAAPLALGLLALGGLALLRRRRESVI
ncbi:MAG: hypothetical protein CVU56_06435 [Deltaproteobacteria bacterium HGW-Deltaproteobacteria-14]|jgi:MYXO-CTERM domain-containing protein|nr:MAG: hypothetical protein CVU56_06435 [Deltaproteobacteria bacterium HGW-Deltaproteobacteria-14]